MDIKQELYAAYEVRTPKSKQQDALARNALPGGDTRWTTYYGPYPAYMKSAEGSTLTDIDGNQYIDFVNNYTSLVHGHRHPAVQAAAQEAMEEGYIYGAPCVSQFQLAQRIKDRIPGMDKLRFTNSGTEATMMVMRAARAYKGRDLILKFDGCYHGTHDLVEVNVTASVDDDGLVPAVRIQSAGVPKAVGETLVMARYNDIESVEAVFAAHKGEIAAIIVEPVMNASGVIPPAPGFLQALREIADANDALLIFDEIVTFRLAYGGIQGETGVTPDLTALGKIIGGGFGVGAFGGKEEIMRVYEPLLPNGNHHSGTFNGHNVAMRAGIATLDLFTKAEVDRINALGKRLQEQVGAMFHKHGIWGKMTCVGSLLYFQWTKEAVKDARDVLIWKKQSPDISKLFHMTLLNRGLFTTNRGMVNISTALTEADFLKACGIIDDSIAYLKPYIEENLPHLIKD